MADGLGGGGKEPWPKLFPYLANTNMESDDNKWQSLLQSSLPEKSSSFVSRLLCEPYNKGHPTKLKEQNNL